MEDWAWSCLLVASSLVLCALAWEQLGYIRKGAHLPGPRLVIPFLGNVAAMVADPTGFWERQAIRARSSPWGLSWDVILGRFILFVRDAELSHKIFANVRPEAFHLVGHPFGKKLFGEENLIFMFGEEHKDLRRRLAPLFTWKALGVYVAIQERTIRKHIHRWLANSSSSIHQRPVAMRSLCRDMNLETSQEVFVGPYLDPRAREHFTRDYNLFNLGLLALPIDLPGFAFRRAKQAVERLVATLGECAARSKRRMSTPGEQPACLMDFWMAETLAEIRAARESGSPPPPHSSDRQVGQHIFDFLFAAQDASTSSLVWVCALLESNPQVLGKILDEQRSLRRGGEGEFGSNFDPATPVGSELLREMKYTEMVVKEVLRYRPPATMVPHIASVDFPITDSYTVPKGAIVFPSLLESSFQGFREPYAFDPDRFSAARLEDVAFKRNWLLFGAGSHQCLGQRYAINHLVLFTALFSSMVEWERVRTPGCDEILYVPTIVPRDGCLVTLKPRRGDDDRRGREEREIEETSTES
ncbi:hypothetical protein SELMODRAFT_75218 [Selaginella moellendorffii]|uniref:sterol 22-desaturase n=1 Tax=Selaginella moellendorffii TaxID=88036 RepID=D8QPW3_SELML|nr:cytochrome P450 710A1 [Selaginella moellendorffii]EFJ38352.1 hypothetical protein SELMODRAFT_75218 [Selaginella moellendorffii]|eukprot:XP_002960813.1 cytochrome P450 710A1 [Selaginella moellendorffii]